MKASNKIGLGVILEKWAYAVLKSIFKNNNGFRIKHVNWDRYNYGFGLDLRVFKRSSQILGIECKNWRDFDRPYGTDIAIHEIIDRFTNFAGGIKVLVITFISLLTKEAIRLLKANSIHILETNKLIGSKDFPHKGRNSKAFYSLKNKLSKLWFGAKFSKGSSVSYNKIDMYRSDTTHENTSHNTTTKLLQYTIPIKKNYTRNYALNLVKRAIRLGQSHLSYG